MHHNYNSKYLCSKHKGIQLHKKYTIADKSHIDPNTVLLGNFSYPLSSIVRSSRQKLNGDIEVQ